MYFVFFLSLTLSLSCLLWLHLFDLSFGWFFFLETCLDWCQQKKRSTKRTYFTVRVTLPKPSKIKLIHILSSYWNARQRLCCCQTFKPKKKDGRCTNFVVFSYNKKIEWHHKLRWNLKKQREEGEITIKETHAVLSLISQSAVWQESRDLCPRSSLLVKRVTQSSRFFNTCITSWGSNILWMSPSLQKEHRAIKTAGHEDKRNWFFGSIKSVLQLLTNLYNNINKRLPYKWK